MDVPLYALALVAFGVLYLVLGVFLVFTLLICFILIYLYLVLRFDKLPESYPHTAADTTVTAIFIGATWGIFTFLAPKNPIPFVGNGLQYAAPSPGLLDAILTITVIFVIAFLAVGAFIMPRLGEAATTQGPGSQLVPTK